MFKLYPENQPKNSSDMADLGKGEAHIHEWHKVMGIQHWHSVAALM